MFNLDKILKRALSDDTKGMLERFKYCIKIENGVDSLFVYLTQKELKRITLNNSMAVEDINIPDKKIQKLWDAYYKKQGKCRKENLKNISLDDIPDIEDIKYADVAHLLTVEEWMKMVDCKAVTTRTDDGRLKLAPLLVLENFEIERLINRTDIHDDFIYEIDLSYDGVLIPATFRELKECAKIMATRITSIGEYADNFDKFLTWEEYEKIINREIVFFKTVDKVLMVAVDN